MMGQDTHNKPTDYWKEHDISKGEKFAILTNIIHQEWAWFVEEYEELRVSNCE
jgi:hypothetical protein